MAEEKTGEGLALDAARREARWRAALDEAETALAHGEPKEAEARAKALSALVKATEDIDEWKKGAATARLREQAEERDALLRELHGRFDRLRRAQGLGPLPSPDEDLGAEDAD